MANKMDEMVLVVERTRLFDGVFKDELAFNGFTDDPDFVGMLTSRIHDHCEVMRRGDAENDIRYKQPIPYIVLRQGDNLFCYKRLSGGDEARLHSRMSLGVGGHMNVTTVDATFSETFSDNAVRELYEELAFHTKGDKPLAPIINVIGYINDDKFLENGDLDPDYVGNAHIGLLAIFDVPSDVTVSVRETDQLEGGWYSIQALRGSDMYDRMEEWSKIAIDALCK